MASSVLLIQKIGYNTWQYTVSGIPPFEVWHYGLKIREIGANLQSKAIATSSASGTLIKITLYSRHQFETGDSVTIAGHSVEDVNDTWTITRTGYGTFTLNGSTYDEAGTGGTVVKNITSITFKLELASNDTEEPPLVEIIDSTEDASLLTGLYFAPRVSLQWRGHPDLAVYKIEEYIASTWTEILTLKEPGTGGYYLWVSSIRTDADSLIFRIGGYDTAGNASTLVTTTSTLIAKPAVPTLTYTLNGGDDTIDITER